MSCFITRQLLPRFARSLPRSPVAVRAGPARRSGEAAPSRVQGCRLNARLDPFRSCVDGVVRHRPSQNDGGVLFEKLRGTRCGGVRARRLALGGCTFRRTIQESKPRWRSTPPGAPSSGCCWTRWSTATGWGWCATATGTRVGPERANPGTSAFMPTGGLPAHRTRAHLRCDILVSVRRHHYGTTGNRLHLDVRAHFAEKARLYPRDPLVESVEPIAVNEAIMGDIVKSDASWVELSVEVVQRPPSNAWKSENGPRRSRCTARTTTTSWVAASGLSGLAPSAVVVRPPPAGKATVRFQRRSN